MSPATQGRSGALPAPGRLVSKPALVSLWSSLDRVSDGVIVLDRDWTFTFLNTAGARLIGHSPDQLVGKNMWTEFPEGVGSEFQRRYQEAFDTQELVEFEAYFEPLLTWFAIRVFPSPDGLTLYLQDVTERRRVQDELTERARQQRAIAELSQRTLVEQRLSNVMSDAVDTVSATLPVDLVEIDFFPTGVVADGLIRIPIRRGNELLGDLVVHPAESTPLGSDAVHFLTATAALISGTAQMEGQQREARHAATHDSLTGLPNRTLLMDSLDEVLSAPGCPDEPPAVLVVRIDRLGLINNSFGHHVGDELLVAFAERMGEVTGPDIVIGRPGGDLFVVVLSHPSGERDPRLVAKRLHDAMSRSFSLSVGEQFVTVGIGVALADARSTSQGLLRDADAALHQIKARGRNATSVFDAAARVDAVRRLALDGELHRALERDEFRVFYQPVIDLESGRPTGTEALVRWQHPDRGLVAPNEFIGAVEENGLIIALGSWVLGEACRQTASWQQSTGIPLEIWVNVSARQVADPTFAEQVAKAAYDAELAPGSLGLEITESLLMEEAGSSAAVLSDLRAHYVRLALDDFGTGYSSLSYLTRLSVDTLKVDRSFVMGMTEGSRDASIVEAVIQMAHAVDMTVVAEGIETTAQNGMLRGLGCDRGQGFWFARPQPPTQLTDFLREHAR